MIGFLYGFIVGFVDGLRTARAQRRRLPAGSSRQLPVGR